MEIKVIRYCLEWQDVRNTRYCRITLFCALKSMWNPLQSHCTIFIMRAACNTIHKYVPESEYVL